MSRIVIGIMVGWVTMAGGMSCAGYQVQHRLMWRCTQENDVQTCERREPIKPPSERE